VNCAFVAVSTLASNGAQAPFDSPIIPLGDGHTLLADPGRHCAGVKSMSNQAAVKSQF
jgi:hypothetical protein